ncbi:hypothetical protein H9Q73_010338 [Fusarium xylarioides]|nr:hypothetical protein H9Q73_010338 [Fusarium xylarioides]
MELPETTGRQPRANSSCAECRRRRVKCEGQTFPCRQCVYYLVPHLCHYPARKKRHNVSIKSHAELTDSYAKARKVIESLFPSSSLDELSCMTRQQLLIRLQDSKAPPPAVETEPQDHLQVLEPSVEQNFTWDEVSETESETSRVADDVNGLAFSRQSLNASYLGISSVPTILKVISHLSPHVQQRVPKGSEAWRSPSTLAASPGDIASLQIDEIPLINAYFSHVHPVIPMVDEADFRQRYPQSNTEEDEAGPWLALLNMVLAMGSMASDSIHFSAHNHFYKRALPHLNINSFGFGHLYMVQALALYSGMVLHFLNKPNMAVAVMGATLQMAVAMGLHRVQASQATMHAAYHPANGSTSTRIPITLTSPMSVLQDLDYGTISLAASERFCRIATRVQQRLARLPLISPDEIDEFDHELIAWKDSLHMFLGHREQCPPSINTARAILWWRWITTRLTLYRPGLLITALRQKPWGQENTREAAHARKCVQIAKEGVDLMALDWVSNQFLCWNSAWNLFQVSLVLVLGLMSDKQEAGNLKCYDSVCQAIELFALMEPLDAGCTRSRKLLQGLLDNTKGAEENTAFPTPEGLDNFILDYLGTDLVWEDVDWLGYL